MDTKITKLFRSLVASVAHHSVLAPNECGWLYLGASGAWFTFFPALSRAILDNALVPRRCAKFVVQYYLPFDNCATNANRCSDPTIKQFTPLKI